LAKSHYLEGSPISDKERDDDEDRKIDMKMEELSSISDNNEKT